MRWFKKIDDLNEGQSVIELDIGDSVVRGVYLGLIRVSIEGRIKWYFEISEKGNGEVATLVEVREVEKLKVLYRGK